MKSALRSVPGMSAAAVGRHPDVALAVGVAAIIAMLILPLPSLMLDGLLATNLALAAVILVAVLLSQRPLAISTFPTLLLITTLFRLALNVSTTRMILAQGTAGDVVKAFGEFVIRGDVIVGLVVFLVITLVQFLVIGKGAERVAEVGARFTLDAMPGKQMSIDAAVRAGSIDEAEGQAKREELGRESQFYGAMDGAMKFVKGDAIAGLIITALNLIAGLIIGVVRNKMDLATAAETYTILTVGDGLVSQLPALLITLSAGVLTTRVAAKDQSTSLGANLKDELFSNPKVLAIGSGFALALGLVPGLPVLPFLAIASALAGASLLRYRADHRKRNIKDEIAQTFKQDLDAQVKQVEARRSKADIMPAAVTPIAVDCDPKVSALLELHKGQGCNFVGTLLDELRETLFVQTGVRFPTVLVRQNAYHLADHEFVIRITDVPVFRTQIMPNMVMVMATPEQARRLGVEVVPTPHPTMPVEVCWVSESKGPALKAAGFTVWEAGHVIAVHLKRELTKHASSFLGLQDVANMVERLERVYPTLVKEVVPKLVSLSQLADILRRLVSEDVCIRDLKSVLECLADAVEVETDRVQLTEHVRGALRLQLAHDYVDGEQLKVITLDSLIEETVASGITHVGTGSYLALEDDLRTGILRAIARAIEPMVAAQVRPVILTNPLIRRYVRTLIASHLSWVAVLSYQDIPPDVVLSPMGRAIMAD